MENRKWLKRKYPDTYKEVNSFLDDKHLAEFKKRKYKLGRLVSDVISVQKYPKGRLIMFKRSNPINNHNYPLHHVIIKCQKGFTESGYHNINICDNEFIEVVK
jgi:hypothetical protein